MSDHSDTEGEGTGYVGKAANVIWNRLPLSEHSRLNLEDIFQPEDLQKRLLPREEVQLSINLAWYRDILGIIVFGKFRWVMGLTILVASVIIPLAMQRGQSFLNAVLYALIPFGVLIVVIISAVRARIEHNQWRLVKTNARFIISIPQHGSFPLVDNIELKGAPNVIDTNWSRNPVWRIFQFFTGARDLYLSLTAYRFIEGTAKVGDALIIPDIMPQDVHELKRLVFLVPPPPPIRVVFPDPQQVIVTEPKERE